MGSAGGRCVVIWSGWGILVFVFTLLSLVVAQAGTNALLGARTYEAAGWPKAVAALIAAAAIWVVGTRFERQPGRVLIDKKTGREFTQKRRDTFFFIPMRFWAPIVLIVGVLFAVAPH